MFETRRKSGKVDESVHLSIRLTKRLEKKSTMSSLCYISNVDSNILRTVGIYTSSLLSKQGVENRENIVKSIRTQVEEGSNEEAIHSMLELHDMYFSTLEGEGLV